MKAITLKHPWPWAVCVLNKRIENRTWEPWPKQLKIGDWLAIHGGKWPTSQNEIGGIEDEANDLANDFKDRDFARNLHLADVKACSGIVAVCKFGGVVTESDDPWFEGPFGWLLNDLVVLRKPVPCKGAQGLWDLPEDVLEAVRSEWTDAMAMAAEARQ